MKLELGAPAVVSVMSEGKTLSSASLKPGIRFPAVDLLKEVENVYIVTVTPEGKKSAPLVWRFADILPKAMVVAQTGRYYFADEGAVKIAGRINMELEGTQGAELAVALSNSADRLVYSSVGTITGNDFLFTLPLAMLPVENRCTVRFTLRIKGKAAGEETRSFYVMRAI